MKKYEKLKSWKTRLDWPVLDFKTSSESFELNHNLRKKKYDKVDYFSAPLRSSNRLKGYSASPPKKGDDKMYLVIDGLKDVLSPEALAQRSNQLKVGVRCHHCREKQLCGEEDCKRCGDLDMDQLCLGKTDCSICHSSKGVLCRGCLKNQYGEELEEVRANKGWVCPHCIEDKGINPYWICNRSSCIKKQKMAPIDDLKRSSMGKLRVKNHYEEVRKAQILENQARLASLGLQNIIGELRVKSQSEKKIYNKVDYFSTPLRSSNRLKGYSASPPKKALAQRSNRLKVGVPCHHCCEKQFCGEEVCKRCGDLDMDEPCLGKTDCSICHSSNGVLCRGCLKNRYGEELEEVRANKGWVCPHCIEGKGINPYWMCNRSSCLKRRKTVSIGRNAIFKARKMGYKSVAHLLMAQLQGAVTGR